MELQVSMWFVQGKRALFLAFSRHSENILPEENKSGALVSCVSGDSLKFVQRQWSRKDQLY